MNVNAAVSRRGPGPAPWLVAVAALALALPAALDAQQRQQRGGPPGAGQGIDREEMQQRIRARFGEIVRRQLALDDEAQEALVEVIRTFESERRSLAGREMELRRRLRGEATLAPRDAPPLMAEPEAREVIAEMRAIQEAEVRLFAEEQAALLEVLTAPQLVRFYALREGLMQRVRQLREGPGGPRGGPGSGPAGSGWPGPGAPPPAR